MAWGATSRAGGAPRPQTCGFRRRGDEQQPHEPQIEVEGVGGLSELSEPGNRKGSGTPRGRKGSPGRSASPRGSSPRGSSPRGGKKESSKKGPAAKLKMGRKK